MMTKMDPTSFSFERYRMLRAQTRKKFSMRRLCLVVTHKAWSCPIGGDHAAFMYSLIGSAKLNNIDPQAKLADVIARISVCQLHPIAQAEHP
jgi:hypothetical protein